MLVQNMVDIPLEALPVIEFGQGEYTFSKMADALAYHDKAVIVDEKGCLLGRIP